MKLIDNSDERVENYHLNLFILEPYNKSELTALFTASFLVLWASVFSKKKKTSTYLLHFTQAQYE